MHVASIEPCPSPPTPGDSVLVMVTLGDGASNQLLAADKDGAWSGDVTFSFSDLPSPTVMTASCRDFFGNGSNPYATYQAHDVEIASAAPATTTTA